MKIGKLSKRSGLSAHTIRYYERIGLLPYAGRDASGQRDYDDSVLVWIDFIGRLKTTGMPIADMLRYARLRAEGPGTERDRQALLVAHRDRVLADIAARQAAVTVLDKKIASYEPNQSKD